MSRSNFSVHTRKLPLKQSWGQEKASAFLLWRSLLEYLNAQLDILGHGQSLK
jgi:hypothetical protein